LLIFADNTNNKSFEKENLMQQTNDKEDLIENLESNREEIVMESVINKNILPSTEKSENNNIDISNNNNIFNEKMEIENCVKSSSECEIKDGNYFLKLLNVEKTRILKIADEMESELKDLQSDVSFIDFKKFSRQFFVIFINISTSISHRQFHQKKSLVSFCLQ
jgi:hypothetical protein